MMFWILEYAKEGAPTVVGGPYTVEQLGDDDFDCAMVKHLSSHPWDASINYAMLLIDEKGIPVVEEFDEAYWDYLISLAWGDDEFEDDPTDLEDIPQPTEFNPSKEEIYE